ncbi:hypothetical protein VVD49_08730 [Uliginosibacterium sp. H3]|uniref:Glycosyltransferase RgtA/B/C/D-like domain-containing protein n=1 Tax=Uliginosibacterium silvisoli TaxID=3114758 RepID=A0ABU6K2Y3_9RHOO|nr:hypothetical protein [Uliginosibacterium sp. H3]
MLDRTLQSLERHESNRSRTAGVWLHANAARLGALVVLCAIGLIAWSMLIVPPNMDEFIPYMPIACGVHENAPRELVEWRCGQFPAQTVWHYLYARPYQYVGMLSSAIYYPVFRAWPSIYSNYLLGLVFALAFYACLIKLHRLNTSWICALLCFFPITFQMIHDTGPVRFSLLAFGCVALLTRRMESAGTATKFACGALVSLFIALAIEDKPFFALLLPGLACYALAFCESSPRTFVARNWPALATSAILLTLWVSLIVFQRSGDNLDRFYYQELLVSGRLYDIPHLIGRTGAYLLSPVAYTHRIYLPGSIALASSAALFVVFFWLPIFARGLPIRDRRSFMLLLSALLLFLAFLHNKAVWAGHHFIFMMVPLLSLYLGKLGALRAITLKAGLAAGALSAVTIVSFSGFQPGNSGNRDEVFDYLSSEAAATESVFNFSEWGMYYQQALYGPSAQVVTMQSIRDRAAATPLIRLATKQGREILNICAACDLQTVSRGFGGLPVEEIKLGGTPWKIFKVSILPSRP